MGDVLPFPDDEYPKIQQLHHGLDLASFAG
jgi:hypothetical protein